MKIPAERSVPQRHRIAVTWVGYAPARRLRARYCAPCDKLALHSAEDARAYIALVIRSRFFEPRDDDYTFAPYPCPHLEGMWHAGHHYNVAELIEEALKGAAK